MFFTKKFPQQTVLGDLGETGVLVPQLVMEEDVPKYGIVRILHQATVEQVVTQMDQVTPFLKVVIQIHAQVLHLFLVHF